MHAWYDFCFPGIPVVTPMFPSPSSPAVNPWLTAWCRAMTTTLSGSINTSAMSQVGGALMRFHWIIKVWKDISFQSIWFNLNSNCPYACPHFHTIVNSIQKVNWQKFWISSILFCWCWECHYNVLAITQINMLYHSIPCFIVKIWCMKLDYFRETTQPNDKLWSYHCQLTPETRASPPWSLRLGNLFAIL